jgi:NACHT domain
MSDLPNGPGQSPPHPPTGARVGIWQGIAELFTSGPVSKTVQIILGSDLLGFLTRLAAAVFVTGNVYAKPAWIGVALLSIGGVSIAWAISNKKWRGVNRVVSLVILAVGACFIIFQSRILHEELEYVSSYDAKSLNSVPVGHSLDVKTRSKTTHGGIVAITVGVTDLFQKTGPFLVSVKDESGLLPEGDLRVEAKVEAEALTLNQIIPPRKSLTFFIGPGGSGKETILRQWVYALGAAKVNKSSFEHVFLLTSRDQKSFLEDPKQSSKPTRLQYVLAAAYTGIVESPEYFDLLLRTEPCLIVITDWDSIDTEKRIKFLKNVADLVANEEYRASVVIGTRPESLLRDFSIDDSNTFAYERYLRFLRLQPLSKDERDEYFRRQQLPILPKDNYPKTKTFINDKGGDDGIPGELAQNLEFLNVLVAEIDEVQKIDCYTLAHRLTNRRLRRSPEISADKVYAPALLALDRLAFDASQNDTRDLEFAGHLSELDEIYLSKSGLVDIENGSLVFASSAVQSYFAVEGLRDQMPNLTKTQVPDWPPVYSQTMVKDIRKFLSPKCVAVPLTRELAQVKMALACSLNQHAKDYDRTTTKLLTETLGKKSPTDTCERKP